MNNDLTILNCIYQSARFEILCIDEIEKVINNSDVIKMLNIEKEYFFGICDKCIKFYLTLSNDNREFMQVIKWKKIGRKNFNKSITITNVIKILIDNLLSTSIVISEENGTFVALSAVVVAFVFMLILFHFAATIERVLGKLVLHVFSRIALVFIMAMGVKMMIIGLKATLL